ncbi:hypothetical protein ST47_g2222 [Ascochyta rabiei]|uniref:Uncharacterized protein n=1 Tax=Didymella rabiei TaxID=5454 RepID=A0A163JSE4_DIDRA|nr:hypothetical protein ST47_g2222 [Ascochyta rabiei]
MGKTVSNCLQILIAVTQVQGGALQYPWRQQNTKKHLQMVLEPGVEELKRDTARQSERIAALEQQNSNITRLLANYERLFRNVRAGIKRKKEVVEEKLGG